MQDEMQDRTQILHIENPKVKNYKHPDKRICVFHRSLNCASVDKAKTDGIVRLILYFGLNHSTAMNRNHYAGTDTLKVFASREVCQISCVCSKFCDLWLITWITHTVGRTRTISELVNLHIPAWSHMDEDTANLWVNVSEESIGFNNKCQQCVPP